MRVVTLVYPPPIVMTSGTVAWAKEDGLLSWTLKIAISAVTDQLTCSQVL